MARNDFTAAFRAIRLDARASSFHQLAGASDPSVFTSWDAPPRRPAPHRAQVAPEPHPDGPPRHGNRPLLAVPFQHRSTQ